MKGYEAVLHVLDSQGVDTIFSYLAEDVMNLLSHLREQWPDVRLIHGRHEEGAIAMADGYSRANDRVGVCIVGRGPALAHTGTALMTATRRGSKLLLVVPESPLSDTYDIKEFRQESYLDSVVANVVSSRSQDTLVADLEEAFRMIHVGEGPVAVQVPWDVLDGELDLVVDQRDDPAFSGRSAPPIEPADERVEEAVDRYVESDISSPPIVLAGRGAVGADAKESLEALAERTDALLATTLQARGYFSEDPFSLGVFGGYASDPGREYLRDSDFLFAVGCSLNPFTTDSGDLIAEDATVVHVDEDPASFGRYTPVDLGVVGDARLTADAIVGELERRRVDGTKFRTDGLRRRLMDVSPFGEGEVREREGRVNPRELVPLLDRILPDERIVVTDGGHFAGWIVDGIRTPGPEQFIWTLDFLSMGLGLPIGIGAALADERRACVTFCGDLGFMMALQELETAARHGVPITVIVMNDNAAGVEYQHLVQEDKYADVALIETPDVAEVARSLGAEGYTVRDASDVEAISDELARKPDRPVVVDCKLNPDVLHRYTEH